MLYHLRDSQKSGCLNDTLTQLVSAAKLCLFSVIKRILCLCFLQCYMLGVSNIKTYDLY